MITKNCNKCSKELPADTGFYASDNTCKECRKARVKQNRLDKIEYYKAYDKARDSRPDRVKARASYAKTAEGIIAGNKAKAAYAEKNKKKRSAHHTVNNMVRDGKISKPSSCESCGKIKSRIEGHHDDYDKPLEVRWLCSLCHRDWHKKNGEGRNAI